MSDRDDEKRQGPDSVMLDVFHAMRPRWPNKFSAKAAADLLPIWRRACAFVDTAALVPTAHDVAANWPDGPPPSPPAFAQQARKKAAKHGSAITTVERPRHSLLTNATPFWFDKPGPDLGWGRLNADRAFAFVLADGSGAVGITEVEWAQLCDGSRAWGYIEPLMQPDYIRRMIA